MYTGSSFGGAKRLEAEDEKTPHLSVPNRIEFGFELFRARCTKASSAEE
jgi:hypothetical protein